LIVKITEGASAAVIVAGHDIKYYGEAAGSFIDFRSAAMHRSVAPAEETYASLKVVFFLGRQYAIDDGRFFVDGY
jgi:hypothetical protein